MNFRGMSNVDNERASNTDPPGLHLYLGALEAVKSVGYSERRELDC